MVWHIWWLAITAGLAMLAIIIVRSFDDDNEYCLSALEIERIENGRFKLLTAAKQSLNNDTDLSVTPLAIQE